MFDAPPPACRRWYGPHSKYLPIVSRAPGYCIALLLRLLTSDPPGSHSVQFGENCSTGACCGITAGAYGEGLYDVNAGSTRLPPAFPSVSAGRGVREARMGATSRQSSA